MPRNQQPAVLIPAPRDNFKDIDRSVTASVNRAVRAWDRLWCVLMDRFGIVLMPDYYSPSLGDRYHTKHQAFTQGGRCLPKGTVVAFIDFDTEGKRWMVAPQHGRVFFVEPDELVPHGW